MTKVHVPINISFLVILLVVMVLAIIQGGGISSALLGKSGVSGNEIQQIAFILLTLFILITATLHPDKMYLSAYSSMTLGLIVIIGSFFGMFKGENGLTIFQFLLGVILIVSGALLFKHTKLSGKDKTIVYEGIKNYKK
tara:strand:- start:297 stop:713 length:417 start_codon:yes stop_codon:yes gene_type:complete